MKYKSGSHVIAFGLLGLIAGVPAGAVDALDSLRPPGTQPTPASIETACGPEPSSWPHSPTVNVPVTQAAGGQIDQVAIPDGSGGAILAWTEPFPNGNIYVQRISANGGLPWGCDGIPLCTLAGDQSYPAIITDEAGGAIVAWHDLRGATYDIYAQRISVDGVPLWAANGVAVCTTGGDQLHPAIASDGASGVIVAWTDGRSPWDIYAQRISASGVAQWAANGIPVCTAAGTQQVPVAVSEWNGGAVIAWRDFRGADQDIYAQLVTIGGNPIWGANGIVICNAANDQYELRMVSDDAGGAIMMWLDERNGSTNVDLYAQRVNGLGAIRWTLNGVAVCSATGNQANPSLASDGFQGALAAWQDPRNGNYDIYVQRVANDGSRPWSSTLSPGFGLQLYPGLYEESHPTVASDGAGGAIVAWQDNRSANYDIFARRVEESGIIRWTNGEGMLCTQSSDQTHPLLVPDGAGGGLTIWRDSRSGNVDLYAQRVEHFGYLGNPEPVIESIQDVPGDEGGVVSILFQASYLEQQSPGLLGEYIIWRSVSVAAPGGLGSLSDHPGFTSDPEEAMRGGRLLYMPTAEGNEAWEYVGLQAAAGQATYQFDWPTAVDSTASGNPLTTFMIQARRSGTPRTPYFFSKPASGYSVDNLAPQAPTGFVGLYGPGAIELRWHPNPEPDVAEYRIYRGLTADFLPGPSNYFAAQSDTDYVGAAPASYIYKLTAMDTHGNESPHATVVPWQTGLESPLSVGVILGSPTPNPARGSATISWSLPEAGHLRIELIDIQGRRVSLVEDGLVGAGSHVRGIPLRDDAGRSLASGLYFIRLDFNGIAQTRRVAVVR